MSFIMPRAQLRDLARLVQPAVAVPGCQVTTYHEQQKTKHSPRQKAHWFSRQYDLSSQKPVQIANTQAWRPPSNRTVMVFSCLTCFLYIIPYVGRAVY